LRRLNNDPIFGVLLSKPSMTLPGVTRRVLTLAILAGMFGCASVHASFGPLEDEEVYVAPRPHLLDLEVAVLKDRRPSEEVEWGDRHRYSKHLNTVVTDRIVEQLRRSRVFLGVHTHSGPVNQEGPGTPQSPLSQNVDGILLGSLSHFHGRTVPGGQIEGHVEFSDLKLYSTHTGRLIWEGDSNKEISRREIKPGRETQYTAEALRGAINQLAIQLSQFAFERESLMGSGEVQANAWRVGVWPLSDRRVYEGSDTQDLNNRMNDPRYEHEKQKESLICSVLHTCSLYGSRAEPGVEMISAQWIQKLVESRMFGRVVRVPIRGQAGPEEVKIWYEEGIDAILIGNLTKSYASIAPPSGQEPFPIWSGGMGFRRLFKVVGFTQFQEVRLVDTRDGHVIWQGDAEYGIDQTLRYWPSTMDIALDSVNKALDKLVKELNPRTHSPNGISPPV
jgi:hypothetical protein